jgi:hypothetical protein
VTLRGRLPRILVGALAAAAAAGLGFVLVRPTLEARVRARVEREARRLGLASTLGRVRLSPALALELHDLVLENARLRVQASALVLRPPLSLLGLVGRAVSVEPAGAGIELPGLRVELAPVRWSLERGSSEWRLRAPAAAGGLVARFSGDNGGRRLVVEAQDVRLSRLGRVLVHGCPLLEPGALDGVARVETGAADAIALSLRLQARGLALASWVTSGALCAPTVFGAPTDAALEAEAVLHPLAGSLRVDRLRAAVGGAEATGRASVEGGLADPRVDIDVAVQRLDLAALLATAALDLPASDLGFAALSLRVSGPLLDPGALVVAQRLDFTPPARPLPAIERLKGPFVHHALAHDGRSVEITLAPESPDFVPLADVPPLLVLALLLAEDAGFYGHRGIDLGELPVALATNLVRGHFARGASTIPQQLAKNLFLSGRKTLSRKLEEASLALLLDASLGKARELELYLNVIEWGPGVYGLRSAARHYFGREPGALTVKQMAFLISLIPGPIKYQRSFADGALTPFFDGLMAALLAKLLSVGALTAEEYAAALAEPISLRSVAEAPDEEP